MFKLKNILISGASGSVGYGILDSMKNFKQYSIRGIYHGYEPPNQADNVTLVRADLTKSEAWAKLRDISADVLIHCAAKIPASFSDTKQRKLSRDNFIMDELAITYALETRCKFIYISSTGVYGYKFDRPCDESSELSPPSMYFEAKVQTERNIVSAKEILGYYIFRISAPYGPFQRNKTVMKTFIADALKNKTLFYYGSGSRTQDFISVEDIAGACLSSIEKECYGIYNIASGRSVSMKALAMTIKKLAASESEIRPAAVDDPQEGYRALFDIRKAKQLLSWIPLCTLERGLDDLIKRVRNAENL